MYFDKFDFGFLFVIIFGFCALSFAFGMDFALKHDSSGEGANAPAYSDTVWEQCSVDGGLVVETILRKDGTNVVRVYSDHAGASFE